MAKDITNIFKPLTYQGITYPSREGYITDGNGVSKDRTYFRDYTGQYYAIDDNGNAVPMHLYYPDGNNGIPIQYADPISEENGPVITPSEDVWDTMREVVKNQQQLLADSPYAASKQDKELAKNVYRHDLNQQRQAIMKAAGYDVPNNGIWDDKQQSYWDKLTIKPKDYDTTFIGFGKAMMDKLTGNTTYRDDPLIQDAFRANNPNILDTAKYYVNQGLDSPTGKALTGTWLPIAGASAAPAFPAYLDAGLTSYFGAKGLNDLINGNENWETTLDLFPLGRVGKSVYEIGKDGLNIAKEWRPFIPTNPNRYYRIVGKEGDPIGDAIESGVIRGPGATPKAREMLTSAIKDTVKKITLMPKAHNYPMFAKGSLWKGSNSRITTKERPYVIRSKENTGPIVWEESNKDFRHKGHAGIFRPNYYGELNSTPTKYFEYFEPMRFGYMRRDFPVDNNPYHNLMGRGITVDRGAWTESDLGVQGERFGEYIGSGGEQTVFEDKASPNKVLKVYNDTNTKDMNGLTSLVNSYLDRNSIPLQEQAFFEGYIKQNDNIYPVFSQGKLHSLEKMPNTEFSKKILPSIQDLLKQYGYSGDGITSEFTNGTNTLVDIKPDNVGTTPSGKLKFLDVDWIKNTNK